MINEMSSYFLGFPIKSDLVAILMFGLFCFSLIFSIIIFWLFLRKRQELQDWQPSMVLAETTQELYRTLLAASPYKWLIWYHTTNTILYEPGLGKRLGLPENSVPLETFFACFDPDDHGVLNDKLRKLNEMGETFKIFVRLKDLEQVISLTGMDPFSYKIDAHILWFKDEEEPERLKEEQLSPSLLSEILDALPIPIWHRSQEGRLDYCNKLYAQALETLPEVALKRNMLLWSGELKEDPSTGERFLKQHTIIDGARRLITFYEKKLGGREGRVGFGVDLSAEEQIQKNLERHIEAHNEVLGHLSAGVIIYGSDKRMKFFNHAYVRMFEMDESWLHTNPLIGDVLEDLHRRHLIAEQADFPAYKKRWLQRFTSLLGPLQELVHLPNERTFRMLASPYPTGGLFLVFEDATDSFALERQSNTQNAVQKTTLDHLYESVAVFGSDNKLRFSNPAFAKIWRLPPERLTPGTHISDMIDLIKNFFDYGEDWEAYKKTVIENLTDRVPKSGRFNRSDESVLEFSYVPLPDGSHLLTYADVTDSYRVEKVLRERNEALETADQLKTEFLDNVTYELKAPLNTIIGFTEIMLNQYLGELNQEQTNYAKGILESSQQLLTLVNDIIDLAEIEAGHMTLNFQPIDVSKLLSSVVSMARQRARTYQIKVTMSLTPEVDNLIADERRLKQALFNLVNNSIKFTPPGGKISLSASKSGNFAFISVSDTGVGISEKDQKRIFKKFERTHEAMGRYEGVGLGLSLVKSLIELHGGRVTVFSKQNSGTKITCQLPLSLPITAQKDLSKIA